MVNNRQIHVLAAVIRAYIEMAQPISSKYITQMYDLGVSPATIRNDMAHLESLGYLRQPHTSAGRVPTENGYRKYLEIIHKPKRVQRNHPELVEASQLSEMSKQRAVDVANALVQLSGETAFISHTEAPGTKWVHMAGVSNLFGKPDFADIEKVRELAKVVDKFNTVMTGMFDKVDSDVNIWIGSENPLGSNVSTMVAKYELPNGMTAVLGLVGPMRMNYQKNMRVLGEAKRLLER